MTRPRLKRSAPNWPPSTANATDRCGTRQRLLTGEQAKIATDLVNEDIAKLERRQQSQERLRVFEGIPLGRPEAVDVVQRLTPDRFRAVLDVLAT